MAREWRVGDKKSGKAIYKRWRRFREGVVGSLSSTAEPRYTPIMSKVEVEQAAMVERSSDQPGDLSHLSREDYVAAERRLVWKLDLRLMPILCVIIVLK
jgi:hypothetical protein